MRGDSAAPAAAAATPWTNRRLSNGVSGAGRRVRYGPAAPTHLLAAAREDAQLEAPGLGEPSQSGHVAPASRRPLLGDDEDLGRPAGLGGQPLDQGRLRLSELELLVALA